MLDIILVLLRARRVVPIPCAPCSVSFIVNDPKFLAEGSPTLASDSHGSDLLLLDRELPKQQQSVDGAYLSSLQEHDMCYINFYIVA